MKNLTPELIAKAKAAKSAEELLELAKANNVELTADEANTYFAQLNANGAVSDDDLDSVAGGSGIFDCGSDDSIEVGDRVRLLYGRKCGNCGGTIGKVQRRLNVNKVDNKCVTCENCDSIILTNYSDELIEKI